MRDWKEEAQRQVLEMPKKVERTAPGSKNKWRITYDSGSKKWTNDRPGDRRGDPEELEELFDDLTVKRGLRRLEQAVNAYVGGGSEDAIRKAVEEFELHAGADAARTAIRKVYSIENTELKQNETDLQKKVVEGLAVAKDHLNRNRKARMVRAYMRGAPPTSAHRAVVDRLRDFWESTNWKSYVSFENATDITFQDKPDYQAVRMVIYTAQNEYPVVVHIEPGKPIEQWYMGAFGGTRLQRPTEDWTRGNDLPDGSFTFELWQEILNSITQYELLDISDFVSGEYRRSAGRFCSRLACRLASIASDVMNEM